MARPLKEINWDHVEKRMEAGNSARDIAKSLRVDINTFYERFKKEYSCSFSDFADGMYECGNSNLAYAQYAKALSGDVKMLAHLGKFRLNQNDKADIESEIQKQLLPFMQQFKDMIERNPVKE